MAQLLGVYDGCGAGFPAASAQPLYRGGRGPPAVPLRQPGVDATAVTGPAAVAALLPTQPTRVPSMVGIPTSLRCAPAVEAFAGWDARYGGGLMREAVTAQLRYCTELLNARCSEAYAANCSPQWAHSPKRPDTDTWPTTTTPTTTRGKCIASRWPTPRKPGTDTCAPRCCARWPSKPPGAATRTRGSPAPSRRWWVPRG